MCVCVCGVFMYLYMQFVFTYVVCLLIYVFIVYVCAWCGMCVCGGGRFFCCPFNLLCCFVSFQGLVLYEDEMDKMDMA